MKAGKSKKIIVFFILCVCILGGSVFLFTQNKEKTATTINKIAVDRGNIATTISGSGTVEPIEQYEVVSTVKGDILRDNVTVGENVDEGTFLYEIDSTNAETSIRKAEIALEKQQLSYEQTMESVTNLTVKSDVSGIVTKLYVEEDDDINSNSKILDITDFSELLVDLPFNISDISNISVGQNVTIYIESSGESVAGNVEKIASGSYAKSTGALVSDIQISFNNPGSLMSGEFVTAMIGNSACNDAGKVYYRTEKSIVAKTSGTIKKLNFNAGDKINKGDIVAEIDNETSTVNAQSGLLSLEDSKLALSDSKNSLNDYYLTSPISGTVISKYYKTGDTLDDNKTTLAVIADMSKLSFSMSIDELDIKNISVGQEVIITADALSNASFKGYITEISILGSSMSGVTTYPVTVVIDDYEGLLPGMNVTAEIVLEEVKDVVRVPVAAVSRGSALLVKEEYALALEKNTNSTTEEDTSTKVGNRVQNVGQIIDMPNTPEGYKYIKVTTGLSDEDYVEIKEGISEGDEIYIITTQNTTESKSTNTGSSMGMMGGMPAGGAAMPNGGIPGGSGMSGGRRE